MARSPACTFFRPARVHRSLGVFHKCDGAMTGRVPILIVAGLAVLGGCGIQYEIHPVRDLRFELVEIVRHPPADWEDRPVRGANDIRLFRINFSTSADLRAISKAFQSTMFGFISGCVNGRYDDRHELGEVMALYDPSAPIEFGGSAGFAHEHLLQATPVAKRSDGRFRYHLYLAASKQNTWRTAHYEQHAWRTVHYDLLKAPVDLCFCISIGSEIGLGMQSNLAIVPRNSLQALQHENR